MLTTIIAHWIVGLQPALVAKLTRAGLIQSPEVEDATKGIAIGAFVNELIAGRPDAATVRNH